MSRWHATRTDHPVYVDVPDWFPEFLDACDKIVAELHGIRESLKRLELSQIRAVRPESEHRG